MVNGRDVDKTGRTQRDRAQSCVILVDRRRRPPIEIRLHGRRTVDVDDIPAILGQVALGERGGDCRDDTPLAEAAAATTTTTTTSDLRVRSQNDERLGRRGDVGLDNI